MSPRLFPFLLGSISALLVAFGCTAGLSETSPAGEKNLSSGSLQRASTLRSWDVIDRAARWKTKVHAVDEPEVVTQPGYVHVRVRTGDPRPVDCFLYDSPIITGQALVRLLGAAEIGIDYDRIRLETVLQSANNPLVILAAGYRREEDGAKGQLFVGLVPRVKVPLVCSQEAKSSRSLKETIDSMSRGLLPASTFSSDSLAEGETLQVFQLWTLFREGQPIGFRQWRAAKNGAGEISTLEIASLLESEGQTLTTTDVRISERADTEGLRLSDWLELVDGELHARAALERAAPEIAPKPEDDSRFSYRVAGLGPDGPLAANLTSVEPLRSSFFTHEELTRVQAARGETQLLTFLPNFHLDQATRLHYRPASRDGTDPAEKGELVVGDSRVELVWKEGQLLRRTDLRSGVESHLVLQVPPAASLPAGAKGP